MRAMRAETFSGYEGLEVIDLPKPVVTTGKYSVRSPRPASRRWTNDSSRANFTARRHRWSWATKERV